MQTTRRGLSLSLRTKLMLLMLIGVLVPMMLLFTVFAMSIRNLGANSEEFTSARVLAEVKDQLRYTMQSTVTAVQARYRDDAGRMSEDQLIAALRREFDSIKYGETGYFFAYKLDGLRILAPENKAQEGKNLWDLTDEKGNKPIQDFVAAAKAGGGFVQYVWLNPATNKREEKLSYVMPLKVGNLELTIGTGTYLPMLEKARAEVRQHIRQAEVSMRWRVLILGVVLAAAMVGVLQYLVAKWIARPVTNLAGVALKVSKGDLTDTVPVTGTDEIGQFAATFNTMIQRLRDMVKTEEEAEQGRRLQANIRTFLATMQEMAQGDLSKRGEVTADVLGNVIDSINVMADELGRILGDVRKAADQVASSSQEMIVSTGQMATGAQAQSREAMAMSSAVEEMTLSVRQVAENASASAAAARQALEAAKTGEQAVENSLHGMQRIRGEVQAIAKKVKGLGDRSLEISEIVSTIQNIAEQTNLLALNAAIEAAGAGEAGMRFGVVADEVRKLAERSAQATKDIGGLIKTVQMETQEVVASMEQGTHQVETGYGLTQQAGEHLKEIGMISTKAAELADDISIATQQQVRGAEGVATAVRSIAAVASQTEQGVVQTQQTVENLSTLAKGLTQQLTRFKLAA